MSPTLSFTFLFIGGFIMWQEAINCFTHKKLGREASEMQSAGIDPIVLRWKKAIRGYSTGSQQIHGFLGCKTSTIEKLDGQIDFSGSVTPDAIVAFYPDEFNVAYAIVPKCERNMNILAATMNDPHLPWVIESPEHIEEIRALAKKLNGTPEKKKPASKQEKSVDATIEELVGAQSV